MNLLIGFEANPVYGEYLIILSTVCGCSGMSWCAFLETQIYAYPTIVLYVGWLHVVQVHYQLSHMQHL